MSGTDLERLSKNDYENLKASKYGFEKYMTAKYYKNLTDSQFSNRSEASSIPTGFRRDSLNPAVNLMRLRQRIATTEAIAARYTPAQREWVRLSLEVVGGKLWKYKFNYLVKFVFLFKAFSEYRHYRHLKNTTIMTVYDQLTHNERVFAWGTAAFLTLILV